MLTFTAGADNNLIPRAGSFAMAQIAHYCRFYRELEPGAVWLDISSNRFSRWFTPEREIPRVSPISRRLISGFSSRSRATSRKSSGSFSRPGFFSSA